MMKKLTKKQLQYIKMLQNKLYWSTFTQDYIDPNREFTEIVYEGKNKFRINAFIGHGAQEAYDYCVLLSRTAISNCYEDAQSIGGVSYSKGEALRDFKYICERHKRVFKVEKAKLLSEEFMGSEI